MGREAGSFLGLSQLRDGLKCRPARGEARPQVFAVRLRHRQPEASRPLPDVPNFRGLGASPIVPLTQPGQEWL